MASQTLASAILNQKAPDIVGSFREGQQFAKGQQVEKLTGQALQEGGGQKLQELIGLDPEVGYALAEAIGARSAKELNRFIGDASITENFFKQGNFDQGRQFIQQSRDTASMAGMSTTSHDNLLSIYDNEGPQAAYEHVQGFSAVLNKTKEQTSGMQDRASKAEALVGSVDPRTDEVFTLKTANQALIRLGAGIEARQGMSAAERLGQDPVATQGVAASQAIIKGASASAAEKAKLEAQLDLKPQVEAAVTTAVGDADVSTPLGSVKLLSEQLALDETTVKSESAKRQLIAAKTSALAEADGAIDRIDGLLSKNRFTAGFGKVLSLTPDIAKSQLSLDVIAELDQIRGLVSLESREKLKGQGTISDSESKTLEKSATVLADPLISNGLARSELNKIKGVFKRSQNRNKLQDSTKKEQQENTQILNFDAQGNII